MSMFVPDVGGSLDNGPLTLTLSEARATTKTIHALSEVLRRHPGQSDVRLRLTKGATVRVFEIPTPVMLTPDLYGEIKSLLGPGCLG
jgi:DNA polymerase-3 subunit alpha